MSKPAPMKITVDGEEIVIKGAPAIAAATAVLVLVNPKEDKGSLMAGGGPLALIGLGVSAGLSGAPILPALGVGGNLVLGTGIIFAGTQMVVTGALGAVGATAAAPVVAPVVAGAALLTGAYYGIAATVSAGQAVYNSNFQSDAAKLESAELQARLAREQLDQRNAYAAEMRRRQAAQPRLSPTPAPRRGGGFTSGKSVGEEVKQFLLDLSKLETDEEVNQYLYGIMVKYTPAPEANHTRRGHGLMGGRRTKRNRRNRY